VQADGAGLERAGPLRAAARRAGLYVGFCLGADAETLARRFGIAR